MYLLLVRMPQENVIQLYLGFQQIAKVGSLGHVHFLEVAGQKQEVPLPSFALCLRGEIGCGPPCLQLAFLSKMRQERARPQFQPYKHDNFRLHDNCHHPYNKDGVCLCLAI